MLSPLRDQTFGKKIKDGGPLKKGLQHSGSPVVMALVLNDTDT